MTGIRFVKNGSGSDRAMIMWMMQGDRGAIPHPTTLGGVASREKPRAQTPPRLRPCRILRKNFDRKNLFKGATT